MATPEEFRCPEYVIIEPDRKVRCWNTVGHAFPFHQGMLRARRSDGTYYAVAIVWPSHDGVGSAPEQVRLAD